MLVSGMDLLDVGADEIVAMARAVEQLVRETAFATAAA